MSYATNGHTRHRSARRASSPTVQLELEASDVDVLVVALDHLTNSGAETNAERARTLSAYMRLEQQKARRGDRPAPRFERVRT